MYRIAVLVGLSIALAGCESEAEKERKAKAEYTTYTMQACRDAMNNVNMVENMRSTMNKPEKYEGGRSFAETVCKEADKAALAQKEQEQK